MHEAELEVKAGGKVGICDDRARKFGVLQQCDFFLWLNCVELSGKGKNNS